MADKIELNLRAEIGALKQDNLQLTYALRMLMSSIDRTHVDRQAAIESAKLLLDRLQERNQ